MAWRVIIPSLSGPTLTWVLILSVDPKLEDWKQEGVGGEGGKGVSRSLAWQAYRLQSLAGRACPAPLHTPRASGWAGSLLPLQGLPPAACQQALRAELFQGQVPASMQAGGTPAPVSPAPFPSVRPPQSRHNRHLGSLTHLYLACFYPCAPLCIDLLLSVLPLGGPRSSPLHTQP